MNNEHVRGNEQLELFSIQNNLEDFCKQRNDINWRERERANHELAANMMCQFYHNFLRNLNIIIFV